MYKLIILDNRWEKVAELNSPIIPRPGESIVYFLNDKDFTDDLVVHVEYDFFEGGDLKNITIYTDTNLPF